jgi:hypothetical protein
VFSDRGLQSMMPLSFTPMLRLKRCHARATNGIPLECPLLLPVDTVNCIQTMKAHKASIEAAVSAAALAGNAVVDPLQAADGGCGEGGAKQKVLLATPGGGGAELERVELTLPLGLTSLGGGGAPGAMLELHLPTGLVGGSGRGMELALPDGFAAMMGYGGGGGGGDGSGAAVESTGSAADAVDVMVGHACGKCGADVPGAFCGSCGTPLAVVENDAQAGGGSCVGGGGGAVPPPLDHAASPFPATSTNPPASPSKGELPSPGKKLSRFASLMYVPRVAYAFTLEDAIGSHACSLEALLHDQRHASRVFTSYRLTL